MSGDCCLQVLFVTEKRDVEEEEEEERKPNTRVQLIRDKFHEAYGHHDYSSIAD